jgi:hypothetical protein
LLKTVSTPQIAKEKIIENTATITVNRPELLAKVSMNIVFNSSYVSFKYAINPAIRYHVLGLHGISDFLLARVGETRTQRHLVLETSALPTELNP